MKRPRIFYGWYVLGVAMLGAFLSTGTSQLFMSIMLKPMTEEFGWSRTAMTGALTAGTIVAGLLGPVVGPLADRYGPRLLTSLGAAAIVGVYAALVAMSDLWHFYLAYIISRVDSALILTGVVPNTAATNWFRRMRGRAMGLLSMTIPLGGAVLILVGQVIIDRYGWRTAFALFGVATALLLVAPSALIMRQRPEDLGLLPDGAVAPPSAGPGQAPSRPHEEVSWTLAEAMRTRTLWLLVISAGIATTANAGISFHQVAYYTDIGIDTTSAVASVSAYALSAAVAVTMWGFLSERIPERLLAATVMLLASLATLYLLTVRTAAEALVFSVLFGLTSRGEHTLLNIILAQYFGRGSFGAINGLSQPFTMIGLGVGPLVSSVVFDLSGSYRAVFAFYGALALVGAALIWMAKKPVRRNA